MKSLLKALLPFLLLSIVAIACNNPKNSKATTSAAAGNQKIAYVESDSILFEMPEYKAAKLELDQMKIVLSKQMEAEQTKAQQYYAAVMTKVQQGSLAPAQQKAEEAKLMKMQEDLQARGLQMEQEMLAKEQELTKPMYDKFKEALKELAKVNGYAYILDKKLLLYSDGGEDASAKLKEKLGIK